MDAQRFDDLARNLSSRRTALGGLLAGLLLPLEAMARKDKGKVKHRKRVRTRTQAEPCWRAGACIPGKGSNVSRCDLSHYTTFPISDCTGCNLSRANLRGVDASGVTLIKANLSGACLVGADFTGATFTNSTNLYNAIFCRTTMPDGSVNNSGCGLDTACCPTAECLASNEGQPCNDGAGVCRAGVCSRAAHTCVCGDESLLTGCVRPICMIQGPDDEAELEALCLQKCADRGGWAGEWFCNQVEVCPT